MRILGLEFGSWSIKAVEMESKWRRLDILDFHEAKLPLHIQNPVEDYKEALSELLSKLPSHPEKTVASLLPAQAALRFLTIPVKQRKKAEQMYRFELEDTVPFRLEEAVVEHHINRVGEGSLVFAAIAPKRFVQLQLDWCKSIGLEPDWLTFDGMGTINLFLASLQGAENAASNEPLMLLDAGHTKTNIAVIDQGILKFFRSVPIGGFALTKAIALNQSVPLEEAESLKAEIDLGQSGELVDLARQSLGPLITDLNHTLVSFRNQYQITPKNLVLTGGTSKLKGLTSFLAEATGLATERFRPFSGLNVKAELQKHDEFRFAEAWGRAMVFARKSPLLFNFRKGELAKQTSLNEVSEIFKNPHIIKLMQFGAVFALILFLHVNIASYLAQKQSNDALEALRKVFTETFRTIPVKVRNTLTANPADLKKFVDQKTKDLDQKLALASRNRVPMASVIKQISGTFPNEVRVDVNTLQLDDKSLLLEGVLYDGDLNLVTENLKKLPTLSEVSLKRDGQRFTYQAKVMGR